jgi:hypothetical protein
LQQFAGGVSAAVAGWLIVQRPNGSLAHFDWLGYVVMAITLATFALMYRVNRQVSESRTEIEHARAPRAAQPHR